VLWWHAWTKRISQPGCTVRLVTILDCGGRGLGDLKTVEIGFASANDLPQLADLLAELFELESDFHPQRDNQLRGLRMILADPALGRLFVLRVDGKVAGMANALITISTAEGGRVLLLEDVIVGKEYRGGGLGRRLVEHVMAWAREQGMTRITLLADRDNQAALDFYRKLGFVSSNMTVMRKPLS
jgi:GNAT superfamily N-acetyltransferase